MTRRKLVIVGIVLTTLLIISGGLFFISQIGIYATSDYEEDKLKFDKKLWTINWHKYQSDENERHYMLNDLVNSHLTIGMDSVEIKELLGKPERDFGFSYNLGLYRSGLDPTFLILVFDDKGKLKQIKVETI